MCLNNTALFDEANNDEADRHAQMMQSQRKPKQVGTIGVTNHKKNTTIVNNSQIGLGKTGTEYEK